MIKKVVWADSAISELDQIRKYWNHRNKSDLYSKKIQANIELSISLISLNPKIGIATNRENIRMRLILNRYYLVYQLINNELRIHQFWDNKKNPISMKYTKK